MSFKPTKVMKVLEKFHERLVGKHFDNNITIKTIYGFVYCWLTMNKNVVDMC